MWPNMFILRFFFVTAAVYIFKLFSFKNYPFRFHDLLLIDGPTFASTFSLKGYLICVIVLVSWESFWRASHITLQMKSCQNATDNFLISMQKRLLYRACSIYRKTVRKNLPVGICLKHISLLSICVLFRLFYGAIKHL